MPAAIPIERKRTAYVPGARVIAQLRATEEHPEKAAIYNSSIRRLGRRAGIHRMSAAVFVSLKSQAQAFVDRVLARAGTYREFQGRSTLKSSHFRRALAAEKNPIHLV